MILDISDKQFKRIFSDTKFHLPIRWNNKDFLYTLKEILDSYLEKVKQESSIHHPHGYADILIDISELKRVNNLILLAVEKYLDGFPAKAYRNIKDLMKILENTPLKTYYKSISEQLDGDQYRDPLNLYRITCVNDNVLYDRNRVFHTPYYLRSKVSTSRYSIAGFPSLYLGTSIDLCCEEVHLNPHQEFALVSRFQFERQFEINQTEIKVIELAIKPQDFSIEDIGNNHRNNRYIKRSTLSDSSVRNSYILWYPLIAACSFIRVNKKDPFSAEYIIPQLLMQWIRSEINIPNSRYDRLVGIRYFSCASEKASEMGFNYVFPASGKKTQTSFCPTLAKAFKLTKPYYLHEFADTYSCERVLVNDNELDYIE